MTDGAEQVRSFNRTVTEVIGALSDRYLGRGRPLGEARVLWEVGPAGCDLAAMRERLALDSGYLSRMLRSLEADGLIQLSTSSHDRRARVLRLTARGRREWTTLDERSDELAAALLEPLSPTQQQRLVAAMGDVERLLTAASVSITAVDPEHEDARSCLELYAAELNARSSRRFDPAVGATALPHELRPPAGEFFVAYLRGEPIGCGAVKHPAGGHAEIKRMWIAPQARGLGLGRRLLQRLERCALAAGASVARIETSSDLGEALSLYATTGWIEVAAFNDEPFADRWLEKTLEN
ncbi:MAG TPA: MarR family winged helix-turn-helix transcriptional regulator [Solirubrobacteraceae bacterium]|jgi:DNA-binding MarR family transcriptional regulator/GNAT superfamily N-acetyltransferase|nr:MarR family winged helix-turn-helix transcriptional regulator [Solirubrobacteraceae bacterium]